MADTPPHATPAVTIRETHDDDWSQIWPIVHDVITEQQTFPYDPAMSEHEAKQMWLLPAPARVTVAADGNRVLGTANMYANRPGPGSHIASGSLMVARHARGSGVGRALVTDMITWARRNGFAAIQFNAVVDTNASAIRSTKASGSSPSASRPARSAIPPEAWSGSASCGWTYESP
jgi:GNAT superfamily N-acetyltransferase